MKWVIAGCSALVALALCSCSSTPSVNLPLTVGNGLGSQYGNYAARQDGEMTGPSGERCVVYTWDRPLTPDLAVRMRSASCESQERPGWMVCTELSRTVIPLSDSSLKEEPEGTPP